MKITLNPDRRIVQDIMKRKEENDGYCPCALIKTPDTKCMCKEFREAASGMCHCGLFIKEID